MSTPIADQFDLDLSDDSELWDRLEQLRADHNRLVELLEDKIPGLSGFVVPALLAPEVSRESVREILRESWSEVQGIVAPGDTSAQTYQEDLCGCPTSEFVCPSFVEAGLAHLAGEIERVEWNRTQQQYEAPTGNNGGNYETPVFSMSAYYWGDDDEIAARPNFKCGDFEIRWYKYLGRGMSMNQDVDATQFHEVMERCLQSVRDRDVAI